MDWNNYFNTFEKYYNIKIDSVLRDTITNHFKEDLLLYTDQGIYEQSRKLIYNVKYNKR